MMDDLLREVIAKLEESAYEYGEGQFSEIEYCCWCHYVRLHPHGDDCPIARIQQRLDTGGWIPIETAPKDGTLLQLLIDATDERENPLEDSSDPTRTIGFNNFDNDGEDKWLFSGWCWTHDHFTEGHGTPTHWQPLPALPKEK